jgi:hypothetical protein
MGTTTEETAPSTVAEFEIEGVTLVYDFNELRLAQMKLAEAVYQYQADLEKRPPRSFKEKLDLGGADYDLHVLSYILLKRMPDGTLQRFKGGETQQPILKLLQEMPAKDVARAEEVIGDFFAKRGRYTLALLVRSKYDRIYIGEFTKELQRAVSPTLSGESSANGDDVKIDSGIPANESAG